MFTGLIREFAEVESYANNILTLRATYKPNIGDSIAINGACLTVIALFEGGFSVELSLESRSLLAVENLKGKVHMEPALALGDRLDGHMVQGHVDCIGVIESFKQRENGLDIEVIREEDGETYGEIGLHKCAAESLALFCRSYLSAYDSVTKND